MLLSVPTATTLLMVSVRQEPLSTLPAMVSDTKQGATPSLATVTRVTAEAQAGRYHLDLAERYLGRGLASTTSGLRTC